MHSRYWYRFAGWGFFAYVSLGAVLTVFQERIFLRPEPLSPSYRYGFAMPYEEIDIPYSAGANLHMVRFAAQGARRKGVVLYLHGNRRNVTWYAPRVPAFTRRGYEVWMVDYPGFGKSTGPLTEEMLKEYALQACKRAVVECGADSLVIYGRSLGTGLAGWLAARVPAEQLILETPYWSFASVMARYLPVYPVEMMSRFRLPLHEDIPQVRMPVTIFHGTADGVIPYENARLLKGLLKPGDRFVTIEGGGHNDLDTHPLYGAVMDTLLSR